MVGLPSECKGWIPRESIQERHGEEKRRETECTYEHVLGLFCSQRPPQVPAGFKRGHILSVHSETLEEYTELEIQLITIFDTQGITVFLVYSFNRLLILF